MNSTEVRRWRCDCGQAFTSSPTEDVTSCPGCRRAYVTVTDEDRAAWTAARKQRKKKR